MIFGQCYPNGEAPAIGRVAALDAGLGVHVPGLQIDRRCGSGLQAVIDAAMRVQTGAAELVIAGGAESMSQAEHYVLGARFGVQGRLAAVLGPHRARPHHLRRQAPSGAGRHAGDGGEPAPRVQGLAPGAGRAGAALAAATPPPRSRSGRFADEIVPVPVKGRKGVQNVARRRASARRDDDGDARRR